DLASLAFEHRQVPFLTLQDGVELLDVLLAHALVEVETLGTERREGCERGCGSDAIRKQRRRRQRVGPTARDAPDTEPLHTERLADRGDIRCAVGDATAPRARRASVSRPRVRDEANPLLLRITQVRLVDQARAGSAAKAKNRNTIRVTTLAHDQR